MIVVCPICKSELATKAPGRLTRDIQAALDNQHQSLVAELDALKGDSLALVAERERLRESLADMISIIEDEGHVSNYVPQVTAARKILAETALTNAANKQRSTSE